MQFAGELSVLILLVASAFCVEFRFAPWCFASHAAGSDLCVPGVWLLTHWGTRLCRQPSVSIPLQTFPSVPQSTRAAALSFFLSPVCGDRGFRLPVGCSWPFPLLPALLVGAGQTVLSAFLSLSLPPFFIAVLVFRLFCLVSLPLCLLRFFPPLPCGFLNYLGPVFTRRAFVFS